MRAQETSPGCRTQRTLSTRNVIAAFYECDHGEAFEIDPRSHARAIIGTNGEWLCSSVLQCLPALTGKQEGQRRLGTADVVRPGKSVRQALALLTAEVSSRKAW